ncbi:MAG: cation transporter [Clostridiales bacterium]|nr:cation transporter [Clostridiales bacterium]
MIVKKDRNKGALVTLIVGLVLNISLGVAKLVVGQLSGSVSVTSDAFNNISDAGVSVVTVLAVALSARAADHGHPYGHGRYEYIAAFVLGAAVAAVGIEVLASGIRRAIDPVSPEFGTAVFITLGVSIGVKAFMALFYTVRGKKANSTTVGAAAVDSFSDVAVTSVVLVCAVVERKTGAHIDGYVSVAVALFIIVLAVRILKNVIDRLLGARPDQALYDGVNAIVTSHPEVISTHDLIINDYGAAIKIAEIDAVFPADMSFVAVHAVCDEMEKQALNALGVRLSVHADPLIIDDTRLVEIRKNVDCAIANFSASAHDTEIDDKARVVRLDIHVDGKAPVQELKAMVEAEIRKTVDYAVEIDIDYI